MSSSQSTDRLDRVLRSGLFDRMTVRAARELIDSAASLEVSPVTRRLYFGTYREAGHYFWEPGRGGVPVSVRASHREIAGKVVPWERVDGKLNPSEKEGEAELHHLNGWTALGFANRTDDTRGGCNGVLFADSYLSFDDMLADARKHWAGLFDRFKFEIVEAAYPQKLR